MLKKLNHDEFLMYLQPKVDLKSLEVYGAEALVRWNHPDKGFLFPDSFIPEFEENHQIIELDFMMLEKACAYMKNRIDQKLPFIPLSVNMSRVTITYDHFVSELIRIVDEYQIPHQHIEIEILENALPALSDSVVEILNEVKDAGFIISIDDFGAGFSNFNLMSQLPIDIIKLDRSFIMSSVNVEKTKGLISSLVDMIHAMDLKMVCEGVETQENLFFLKRINCDYVQGYYFAKPLAVKEFDLFYESYHLTDMIHLPEVGPITYHPISIHSNDENSFSSIVAHTYPGFLSLRDSNQRIIYLNQNFKDWINTYTDVDPLGKTNVELAKMVPSNVADTFMQCHDGSMELQNSKEDMTSLKKIIVFKGDKDDPSTDQYLETYKFWVKVNEEPCIFTIAYDITHLYLENMRNLHTSMNDYLTGAKNRRYLKSEISKFTGNIGVLISTDHFKTFNETYGYSEGDSVLKNLVILIRENITSIESIVRLSGDEFLIILSHDHPNPREEMENLKKIFEDKYNYSTISFSYGVSEIKPTLDETLRLLFTSLNQYKGLIK